MNKERRPIGIYLHLPWCEKKCPYCDFNAYELQAGGDFAAYADAMMGEIDRHAALLNARIAGSVYVGGGTPSLFPGRLVQDILTHLREQIIFADDCEITLEANPGTRLEGKLADWMRAGINRISLGVQSFNDQRLEILHRTHASSDNLAAMATCQRAGLQRINIDLMYGTPGQTANEALQDLAIAADSGVKHISWYEFTLESNTYFARYKPVLPGEDALAEIEDKGKALLLDAGFEQYEISAWRKGEDPGSQHNLGYWRYRDYLGIGAGAHSKITQPDGSIDRMRYTRLPRDFVEGRKLIVEPITERNIPYDYMLGRLRLPEPWNTEAFSESTGLAPDILKKPVNRALELGFLEGSADQNLRVTPRGMRYHNDAVLLFHPDEILR